MTQSNESLLNILVGRICIIDTPLGVVLAIMSILTTIGNLLVIGTIYSRNLRSEQRTVSNYLVVNLAVGDLIIGLLGEPLLMISYLVPKDVHKELANTLMAAEKVLILALCLSSGTIFYLTIERYLSLEMPLWREKLFTGLPLKRKICHIWIFSLVCMLLSIPFENVGMYTCGLCEFTALVIIILYMRMFIIIRNFNKYILTQGIQQPLVQPGYEYITAKRREHLFAKATFLFVGAYVMCYLPYCITVQTSLSVASALRNGLFVLMLLNSALNPLLYTFTVPRYRREVKRILDSVKRSVLSLC